MAIQHLFAFSKQVQGAAIAAGSPYGCGAFPEGHYTHGGAGTCYYGGTHVPKTVRYAKQQFKAGLIDDPVNLWSTPVVVFNGKSDWTVYTAVARDILKQLSHFVDSDKIVSNLNTKASHVWSLDHKVAYTSVRNGTACYCGRCAYSGRYTNPCCDFNNCHYDLTGDLLKHAYGNIKPRMQARGVRHWIPQHKHVPPQSSSWTYAGLEKWAVLYVPTGCQGDTAKCRIHVNYHGCIANKWPRRKMWIDNLDLNEYGEANNILILYPQASGDRKMGNGCWNWGFRKNDKLFDTKWSVQLRTVMNMVAQLQNGQLMKETVVLPSGIGPPKLRDQKSDNYEMQNLTFV